MLSPFTSHFSLSLLTSLHSSFYALYQHLKHFLSFFLPPYPPPAPLCSVCASNRRAPPPTLSLSNPSAPGRDKKVRLRDPSSSNQLSLFDLTLFTLSCSLSFCYIWSLFIPSSLLPSADNLLLQSRQGKPSQTSSAQVRFSLLDWGTMVVTETSYISILLFPLRPQSNDSKKTKALLT